MSNLDKFITLLNELTLVEVNELIQKLEKIYGISKNISINTNLIENIKIEEETDTFLKKDENILFSIILTEVPINQKISILKLVRNFTGLGLKECKDIVENVPKLLKENLTKEEADKIKIEIENFGGKILMK